MSKALDTLEIMTEDTFPDKKPFCDRVRYITSNEKVN
jgi:hypothetical protein